MRVLCEEPGAERYKFSSEAISSRFGGGGYAMILDGSRNFFNDEAGMGFFFLGADNGYEPAVPLFRMLPLNENIGGGVRGPVLIYIARWVEDGRVGEYEQLFDWTAGVVADADLFIISRVAITNRYRDAGLL